MSFLNGLVFFSPVALLVRTSAGISLGMFFALQAILSITIFVFEIPTGKISDRIGYRNTLVLAQILLCSCRVLLLLAFLVKSVQLFVVEALIEGIFACFSSGTQSAYLYSVVSESEFVPRVAHVGNCGTLGFVVSTISYAFIYKCAGLSGLLVATIVASAIGVLVSFGLQKEHKKEKTHAECPMKAREFYREICSGKTIVIIILLACINIAFILINFFYVDKLQVCGMDERWMTPIILGYSVIQLLAEFILKRIDEKRHSLLFMISFSVAGICMLLFGITVQVVAVILFMLSLPLLLDIPAYILDGIQNEWIDRIEQEDKRAELLSVFNMGVNLVEIVFLFVSASVADAGASTCYCVLGVLMLMLGVIVYFTLGREDADVDKR